MVRRYGYLPKEEEVNIPLLPTPKVNPWDDINNWTIMEKARARAWRKGCMHGGYDTSHTQKEPVLLLMPPAERQSSTKRGILANLWNTCSHCCTIASRMSLVWTQTREMDVREETAKTRI